MRLVVSDKRAKNWIYRFSLNGRRPEMGLGSYPAVSLADARGKAGDARQLVAQGIDPIEAAKMQPIKVPTFTSVAAQYIRQHRREWSSYKHGRQWCATLKEYVRGTIGHLPVNQIDTPQVLKVLQPIWNQKTETAKRIQSRMENILDFATAHSWRTGDNPARWKGHLDQLLARPSKISTVRHHPAMPYAQMANFLVTLHENSSISSMALEWLILTVTRTSETLNGTWEEIDQEKKTWSIPASRMKNKKPHRVPLSDHAMAILKVLPRFTDNPYLFPGQKPGRPLSNMALLQLMRGMGYGVGQEEDYVPHGFRSSFRDWAAEQTSYPREIAEQVLAHTLTNEVEAAYRRGDLFEKRAKMMQDWANWCVPTPTNPVSPRE